MFKVAQILFILISILFSKQPNEVSKVYNVLEEVISGYEKNTSFRLDIDNERAHTTLDVDILWIGNEEYNSKTRVKFIQPSDFENVHLWIWSPSDGQIKKWITKPGTGKKIDISNKKNKLKFDLSSIYLDKAILSQSPTISDTVIYNNQKCIIIDFFKKIKNKTVGPIMKIWLNPDLKLVYKIENYDYKRKKVINEIIFEEYANNFPRLISLRDFKNRKNMSIKVSNYISSHSFEDLNIFNPVDVE